jgi:hypothetical protein
VVSRRPFNTLLAGYTDLRATQMQPKPRVPVSGVWSVSPREPLDGNFAGHRILHVVGSDKGRKSKSGGPQSLIGGSLGQAGAEVCGSDENEVSRYDERCVHRVHGQRAQ